MEGGREGGREREREREREGERGREREREREREGGREMRGKQTTQGWVVDKELANKCGSQQSSFPLLT